jgi:hypothetical protein
MLSRLARQLAQRFTRFYILYSDRRLNVIICWLLHNLCISSLDFYPYHPHSNIALARHTLAYLQFQLIDRSRSKKSRVHIRRSAAVTIAEADAHHDEAGKIDCLSVLFQPSGGQREAG